jgi:Ser/Thr protein kinase RdoA (MazF antagonist)
MNSLILEAYGIDYSSCKIEPLTSGLINTTWKITFGNEQFVLQKINNRVFKNPVELVENICSIGRYLSVKYPDYLFVSPLKSLANSEVVYHPKHGYFRLFPFVKNSRTIDVVSTANQAFEAAAQFGKFTHLLSSFDGSRLTITIPNFHNISFRYQQFEEVIKSGNQSRIKESQLLINEIRTRYSIVETFEKIKKNNSFKERVMHHDTKISNVLLNNEDKGLCIIDLDTVMPGYFISDLGDMMRTYLSPVNEEEQDFDKIHLREDFFLAIIQGYLKDMSKDLNGYEKGFIYYSGLFLIYMQALRFLTDFINDDLYYGQNYEGHNLVRAGNQLALLKKMEEKEKVFKEIISNELNSKSRVFFS